MRAILAILLLLALGAGGYWAYRHFAEPTASLSSGADPMDAELAFFEAMKDAVVDSPMAGEEELRAFAAALTDYAAIEIGSVEAEEGGAVARDVVVTLRDFDEAGMRIDEFRLWGADPAALAAISGGGEEGVRLAERIDARGIEWFGLDGLVKQSMQAGEDALIASAASFAGELDAADAAALEMEIGRYDVGAGRTIIDGLTLFPLSSDRPAEDAAPFMKIMAEIARVSRMASVDAVAVYDMKTVFDFEQAGQESAMALTMPLSGYRGYARGDIESMAARDMVYSMDGEIPAATPEAPDAPPVPMTMAGGFDSYAVSGLRLATLYAYLEKGQLPPTSEHDLMSLGRWRVLGERIEIGGEPFYSVKETNMDLSKFHWLVPTEIAFASDDIVYHIGGFMDYVADIAAAQDPSAADQETMEDMEAALAILEKHGLSDVVLDFDMRAAWDPGTGGVKGGFDLDAADFALVEESAEGALADFESFAALAPAEGEAMDWPALAALVSETFVIDHAALSLEDKGGIAKSFGLAVDFAQLAPEGDPGAAMLRNSTPEDLRQSTAGMMRIAASQAAQGFPPAVAYIGAVADFIQHGGALRAEIAPSGPVSLGDIEAAGASGQDPQGLIDLLGFTLVHERPAEAAGN